MLWSWRTLERCREKMSPFDSFPRNLTMRVRQEANISKHWQWVIENYEIFIVIFYGSVLCGEEVTTKYTQPKERSIKHLTFKEND